MTSDNFNALPDLDNTQGVDQSSTIRNSSPMPPWFKYSVVAGVLIVGVTLYGLFQILGQDESDIDRSVPDLLARDVMLAEPEILPIVGDAAVGDLTNEQTDEQGTSSDPTAPPEAEDTQIQYQEIEIELIREQLDRQASLINELQARLIKQEDTVQGLKAEIGNLKAIRDREQATRPQELPFSVLSMKQSGSTIIVRAIKNDTRYSLTPGQVVDGWKLVNADLTEKILAFVHLDSNVRVETGML